MKCWKLEQAQVDQERKRLEHRRGYVVGERGRAAVQMSFNLNPSSLGESLFVIYSNRSGAAVYRGAYRSVVTVAIDDRLTADKGYDHLEFWLLQTEQQQLCMWANERGEPYWRPDARIRIDFLRESVLDAKGLTKRFEVAIE